MKKFLPYIFIAIVLVGLLGPVKQVRAGTCSISPITDPATCTQNGGTWTATGIGDPCTTSDNQQPGTIQDDGSGTLTCVSTYASSANQGNKSAFERKIGENACSMNPLSPTGTFWPGCFIQVAYGLFYVIPSFLLGLSAVFFDFLISYTLDSALLRHSFVSHAWGVVRDLSNMFFILILLYIAIKVILDIGGHEAKQMIAKVVIMALLINFSMFFTQVVIDSSNILALIFYNKTSAINETTRTELIDPTTGKKDLAGGLTKSFNPAYELDDNFFNGAGNITTGGVLVPGRVSPPMLIGITLVAGAIMIFATYALFVSAFSFLGRLIELFVLIIFAPFAFMSFSIPFLGRTGYIGWDAWSSRLITVAFMAPIFMFFLYFIFLLLGANMFTSAITTEGTIQKLLNLIIPALVVLGLLLKATEFAKKGSGKFGEVVMSTAKIAGGLALGAATGGTALLATGTLGNLASRAASNATLNKAQNEKGIKGIAARMALRSADYGSRASFDVRKAPGVGALAKMGGVNLESTRAIGLGSREGGYEKRRADQVKKRQERAKQLEIREDEPLKQKLNKAETQLQTILHQNSEELHKFDTAIKDAREKLDDAHKGGDKDKIEEASIRLEMFKANKKKLKDSKVLVDGEEVSMANLEQNIIPHVKEAIESENRLRRRSYADRIQGSKVTFWRKTRANKEAAHEIRMGAKIKSGEGHGGGGGGGHAPTPPAPRTPAPTPTPATPAAGGGGGHSGGH